jgi:maltose-binding protein MalE
MIKRILMLSVFLVGALLLSACGREKPLTIWVGSESVDFYTAKMEEYVAMYEEEHGEAFPFPISVRGVDTGTAAGTFLDDPEAGADIFTVAHDNLGRLTAGSSVIAPVTDPGLLAQIESDNPETFLRVIKSVVGGQEYTFGIPYVSQALVLYYNTKHLNETEVQTWEGIWAKAKSLNKNALTVTGTDGFNNSFLLLAKNAANGETSLRLYENGELTNNFATGDDTIAKMKWGQRFFVDSNGGKAPSDSGWEIEFKDEKTLSIIGGAWHFSAAQAALGSDLGITVLPTFTITAADAYGNITEGSVFQSGTFADTKMFVMKKNSDKADYLQDILKFLTSKEVQEQSFVEADNLPAYKNAVTEFAAMQADTMSARLAVAQLEMFQHGIPQPFGFNARFNFYYYSKGGPELILSILRNDDNKYSTDAAILAQMQIIENIWSTGNQ